MENVLELKPNTVIEDQYNGHITLSAWIGFQSRQGFYGGKDSNEASNGLVKVFINGRKVDGVEIVTQEQINALNFLHQNAEKIRDVILNALFNEVPEMKEIYEEEFFPEINSISDFKSFLGLSNIHVIDNDKDGFAYLGYELGCEWDDEHGVGVMMHKDRVIETGLAEVSFDSWITHQDNGTEM